jgi:hypothetical protein
MLLSATPASGLSPSPDATGDAAQPAPDIVLYWGDGCPRCEDERAWLETVAAENPDLTIVQYEVWHDEENRALFVEAGEGLGFTASSVPTTIMSERVWIGWTGPIKEDIADAVDLVAAGKTPPPGVYGTPGAGTCSEVTLQCTAEGDGVTVDVPFFGEVSLGDKSLLMSTLIIGFVDGVNPCSLWVISVLLTIVIRTASRRRVIAVGSTFLAVTAGMYALYMAGIYSALTVVGFIGAIYKRVRNAAGHHNLIPALTATVALAVAVSLLETPCTAGFPVLWTGMLKANGVGFVGTAVLFVAYMIPFLLDEMIVFGIAITTMRASKMQEKHGELLKLIAGVTMLALAAVMVFAPTVMENPLGALALFVAAFALAGAIHLVTARVRANRAAAAVGGKTR